MKKISLLVVLVLIASVVFVSCTKKNAVWLEDGQTLEIIDNTLGEGEDKNVRVPHTYTNSVVTEKKGYVYVLPVSETNPAVRYFVSINQDAKSELIEITGVKDGDTLTDENFLSSEWGNFWNSGLQFVDGKSTEVHYSSVITTTKYCYKVTKNNYMTVWGSKYLAVTVTSSAISENPVNFNIEIIDFHKLPLILNHKGDSWEIK